MSLKERLTTKQEKIISGIHFISRANLRERAATFIGLNLDQNDDLFCRSKEIARFTLDEGFEKQIIAYGFGIDNKRTDGILTIASSGDYWNIKKDGKPIFVLPIVDFRISDKDRGILLQPDVDFSNGTVSPVDQLAYNKMAKAITTYYQETPSIFKEIVMNDFKIVIPWKEIDAGGVRTLSQLFEEWTGDYKAIKDMARSSASPFKPSPYSYEDKEIRDDYLPEQLHGILFVQWEKQLDEFKRQLPR